MYASKNIESVKFNTFFHFGHSPPPQERVDRPFFLLSSGFRLIISRAMVNFTNQTWKAHGRKGAVRSV